MTIKGGVVVVFWLAMVSCVLTGCKTVAGTEETWEEVLTIEGRNVVFGANSTYTIRSAETRIAYPFAFFFGLGSTGEAVRTDTTVTLGVFGDASKIYACTDGRLEEVDVNSTGTPENAIVRVRNDTSTDSAYLLQITESSPPVFVQFTTDVSPRALLCTSGDAGTPVLFTSSSLSSCGHVDEPATLVLRQVVDA